MTDAFAKPVNITCRACGQRHAERYMCDLGPGRGEPAVAAVGVPRLAV